jgi:hypothetical protein
MIMNEWVGRELNRAMTNSMPNDKRKPGDSEEVATDKRRATAGVSTRARAYVPALVSVSRSELTAAPFGGAQGREREGVGRYLRAVVITSSRICIRRHGSAHKPSFMRTFMRHLLRAKGKRAPRFSVSGQDVGASPVTRRAAWLLGDPLDALVVAAVRQPHRGHLGAGHAEDRRDREAGRPERLPAKRHARLLRGTTPLSVVARVAGGHDVLPDRPAPAHAMRLKRTACFFAPIAFSSLANHMNIV